MTKDAEGFESIVVESIKEMPEKQDYVDSVGTPFSDDLHCRSKTTGERIKNKSGQWRKRSGSTGAAKESILGTPSGLPTQYETQGRVAAGLTFTVCMAGGGEVFKPTSDEELFISDAYGRYFQAIGMEDLPPGWALVAALGMYAVPRLQDRGVQIKLYAIWHKITGGANAHADSRPDKDRENMAVKDHSSKTAS